MSNVEPWKAAAAMNHMLDKIAELTKRIAELEKYVAQLEEEMVRRG